MRVPSPDPAPPGELVSVSLLPLAPLFLPLASTAWGLVGVHGLDSAVLRLERAWESLGGLVRTRSRGAARGCWSLTPGEA